MCHKTKQTYNLLIAWDSRGGFIPFLRVIAQSEIQTASSKIRTRMADFIFMTATVTLTVYDRYSK